jgi:xanthine dehydrogenase accessory factor
LPPKKKPVNDIWPFIHQELIMGKRVMLMLVLDSIGSSPGGMGFKMAVAQDGETKGTIGGGIMEYRLSRQAKTELLSEEPKIHVVMQEHDVEGKDPSGLVCAGRQAVAFIPFGTQEISIVTEIKRAFSTGEGGLLSIGPDGLQFDPKNNQSEKVNAYFDSEANWLYRELIGHRGKLFIFGSGHVGLAVSRLFSLLDFHITVFDDRSELPQFHQNEFAHHKEIVDYADIEGLIPDGPDVFVLIMTTNHKGDARILSQLIHKDLRYLGMMGSRKKVDTVFEALRLQGIPEEQIKKVFAPVGIPIGSHGAAEIAVSVAAEIIQVLNS